MDVWPCNAVFVEELPGANTQASTLDGRIPETWQTVTTENPERIEERPDGTVHHLRRIHEHGNRVLRVIMNPNAVPRRVITVFFDRRLRDL